MCGIGRPVFKFLTIFMMFLCMQEFLAWIQSRNAAENVPECWQATDLSKLLLLKVGVFYCAF